MKQDKRHQPKDCTLAGHKYDDDAEVCVEGKCMICHGGEWQETKDLFPPKKSGILSP